VNHHSAAASSTTNLRTTSQATWSLIIAGLCSAAALANTSGLPLGRRRLKKCMAWPRWHVYFKRGAEVDCRRLPRSANNRRVVAVVYIPSAVAVNACSVIQSLINLDQSRRTVENGLKSRSSNSLRV